MRISFTATCALLVTVFGLVGVARSAASEPPKLSADHYLARLAEMFDRAKINSGYIAYRFQRDSEPEEQVSLLFRGEWFYRSSKRVSNEKMALTHEWFDGLRMVEGRFGSNWTFAVMAPNDAFKNRALLFLGHVFNYWEKSRQNYLRLELLNVQESSGATEFSFIDRETQWTIVYVTDGRPLGETPPIRVASFLPDGKLAAEWTYEGWKLRDGRVWFPDRATLDEHWENFPQSGRGTEKQTYRIDEARFNMVIPEIWFIPQFPEHSHIQDTLSDPTRVLVIPEFDFRGKYKDPKVAAYKGRPEQKKQR